MYNFIGMEMKTSVNKLDNTLGKVKHEMAIV